MTSPFRITEADPTADYDVLVALQKECLPGASLWPIEGTHWWLANDTDGEPVGFAGLYIENHDFRQGMLCRGGVVRSARGFGLQRALIRVRERKAKLLGLHRLTTYTDAANIHSMNNIMACGYRLYEPAKGWELEGFLYWQKTL